MKKQTYDYNTFKELFDHEIHYAYESQYGAYLSSTAIGLEYAIFYKLTIFSDGELEYKGRVSTYDPKLWPKVKALVESIQETTAEKILYKQ